MCFVNPPPSRRARVVAPFRYECQVLVGVRPAELWMLLEQPTAYPGWWPWLHLVHREPALRTGSTVEATIRAPLPYRLDLRIRVLDLEPARAIRTEVAGDLAGPASVVLAEHPDGTAVRLSWELEVTRRGLRTLAALARPVLEWGHDRVVADGIAQFSRATGLPAHASGSNAHPLGRRARRGSMPSIPPSVGAAVEAADPAGDATGDRTATSGRLPWTLADLAGPAPWAGPSWVGDGLAAGAVAGILSGAPSTLHALASGTSPLAAARAAGELLGRPGLVRGALAHAVVSLGWAALFAAVLPRRRTVAAGMAAGLAVAALDLGVVARLAAPHRLRGIRSLATGPQVADHVAFGGLVGAVVAHRRRSRATTAHRA